MNSTLLLTLALAASLFLGANSGASAELTRIRAGYPSPNAGFSAGSIDRFIYKLTRSTTYDLFTSRYIKKIPKVNAKGVENSLSLIAESNPRTKNRSAEEFMDTSFIEELESTGLISSILEMTRI